MGKMTLTPGTWRQVAEEEERWTATSERNSCGAESPWESRLGNGVPCTPWQSALHCHPLFQTLVVRQMDLFSTEAFIWGCSCRVMTSAGFQRTFLRKRAKKAVVALLTLPFQGEGVKLVKCAE